MIHQNDMQNFPFLAPIILIFGYFDDINPLNSLPGLA
jgi:hypothetical protein